MDSATEFNKPGPNKRVCAFLIDWVIGQIIGIAGLVYPWTWLLASVFILGKDCFEGQSPGKRFVGTRVVDEENRPASSSQTMIRNIFMVIPLFPIVEYLVMRNEELGRRIGDQAAKTKVNDLKPEVSDANYLWISVLVFAGILFVHFGSAAWVLNRV